MGNAGATQRRKSQDFRNEITGSSIAGGGGASGVPQAFMFDKASVLHGGSSQEDEDTSPYYTKIKNNSVVEQNSEFRVPARKRSSTVSEGSTIAANVTNLRTAKSNLSTKGDIDKKESTNAEERENKDDDGDDQDQEETESEKMDDEQLKNPALPTVLRWDGGGKNVMISGTFSKWKPIPMVRSHGNFVTIIDLPEGDHQYKFCVDGEWKYDPKVKSIEADNGVKNNLVSVRQSDFEVFQALAKDSENVTSSAEKEYSQDVPQVKPWEKVSGPPVLPPHLLQVILNKDTPLSCEPTLLPEPNHVMLNHLYALSIKDGVMVLSATHRYRKKYVTTLLYKPI